MTAAIAGPAKIMSLNVGLPRQIQWHSRNVSTGIYKEPVAGPVMLRDLNLDGDRQADLAVHGGVDKAVYAYPSEHYQFWRGELPEMPLPWGIFGENFSTEGLREAAVYIGDIFRFGAAEIQVTQPRLPCFKLAIRFGRNDIIKRFLDSGRTGFYFRVAKPGLISANDAIEFVQREQEDVTVADITRAYVLGANDEALLSRAIRAPSLPQSWKEYFQNRIDTASHSGD